MPDDFKPLRRLKATVSGLWRSPRIGSGPGTAVCRTGGEGVETAVELRSLSAVRAVSWLSLERRRAVSPDRAYARIFMQADELSTVPTWLLGSFARHRTANVMLPEPPHTIGPT